MKFRKAFIEFENNLVFLYHQENFYNKYLNIIMIIIILVYYVIIF